MRLALGVVALLLALLDILATPVARAQSVTLRLGLPISLDSPTGQNMREFARQVQARTSGALKVEVAGAGGRYEESEILPAVTSGAVEIGATPLTQFTKDVPICASFLQPFLFNFDTLIEAATRPESEIRTLIDKEILRRTGTRVLWWEPYGSSILVSRTVPVNDPVQIVVRPVGATDNQAKELLAMCGGLPQPVRPSEAFAALQKGTLAALATDIMTVREHELWRVADTVTNLRYAPSLFMVVIDEKTWQKLTPEQQVVAGRAGTGRPELHVGAFRHGQGPGLRPRRGEGHAHRPAAPPGHRGLARLQRLPPGDVYGARRGAGLQAVCRLRQAPHPPLLQRGARGHDHLRAAVRRARPDRRRARGGGQSLRRGQYEALEARLARAAGKAHG